MHLMLAREWSARGLSVDIVLLRNEGDLLGIVPADTQVIDLGEKRFRDAILPLRSYLKERQPDVLLAAMWPLTVIGLIATRIFGSSTRTVVSDHEPLSLSYRNYGAIHRALLRLSMAVSYPLADVRIAVSRGVAEDLSRLSGLKLDKFRVIYNPAASGNVGPDRFELPMELVDIRGPLILAVGALKPEKNHELMITAFSKIASGTGGTLCILGEGSLRVALEDLVVQLGLQDRVLLPGFQIDTNPWYRRADLFVMSSNYEGFGNVLVEALEHGVCVVSTDCPFGPREILCDGKFGHLVRVGDAEALAQAMKRALSSSTDHNLLKARARDFSVGPIANEYLDVLLPDWHEQIFR